MLITVELDDEVVFSGEADDFLFENDNDEDIETALNQLEKVKAGSTIGVYNCCGDYYSITKDINYI